MGDFIQGLKTYADYGANLIGQYSPRAEFAVRLVGDVAETGITMFTETGQGVPENLKQVTQDAIGVVSPRAAYGFDELALKTNLSLSSFVLSPSELAAKANRLEDRNDHNAAGWNSPTAANDTELANSETKAIDTAKPFLLSAKGWIQDVASSTTQWIDQAANGATTTIDHVTE